MTLRQIRRQRRAPAGICRDRPRLARASINRVAARSIRPS
jgi:hypothetical protein